MALSKIQTSEMLDTPNLGRRNLIINGAMSINQRAATSGITSGYFVDRFQLSGVSASAVITSSTPTEFPTAITVSATSGNPIILQKIESKMVQHLSGKVVTVSFYAKNISNATTLYTSLQYAGSADNFGSTTTISEQNLGNLTTDWVKYTASWTVPAGGLNGLSLNILCAGSSTFTMGVTGVQLEVGDTATDFEHRSYGEELSLCQRYYELIGFGNIALAESGSTYVHNLNYKVEKRAVPTISLFTTSNIRIRQFGVSDRDAASPSASSTAGSKNGGYIKVTGFNGIGGAATAAGIGYTTSSEAGNIFYISAEL
tara:strand:+ start:120 stop:1061 length:942 start_codon:yes stop_codon:yes gene_type:complete